MVPRILCVDDDPHVLAIYRMLRANLTPHDRQFELDTAPDGEQGLNALASRGPYAVIISDMQMPGINGIDFLTHARQATPDSVRMMLTGYAEVNLAIDAVNEGSVFRFLTKPCVPGKLLKAITAGIEQHRLIVAEKELLERTLTGSIRAITEVLSLVNSTAFGRASRIQHLVQPLAECLGIKPAWHLEMAAMLSQIGCVTVPESILRKATLGARLSADEAEMIRNHPRIAHNLLAHIPRLEAVADAIACQQDRFDGVGTPAEAEKGNLPLGARILKVAIDFDDLVSRDLAKSEAFERLQQRVGWYDPTVLDALKATFADECPWVTKELSLDELIVALDRTDDGLAMREIRAGTTIADSARMILAEDIVRDDDTLLLSKGQEITVRMLERLRNYSRFMRIREPLKVLIAPQNAPSSPVTR